LESAPAEFCGTSLSFGGATAAWTATSLWKSNRLILLFRVKFRDKKRVAVEQIIGASPLVYKAFRKLPAALHCC